MMNKEKIKRNFSLNASNYDRYAAIQNICAQDLILSINNNGFKKILDIGCGSYPYFLTHSLFREKYGIDRGAADRFPNDIRFFSQNLNAETKLPYDDRFFDAVTLLAVIEHLDPAAMVALFGEVHRVLKPGGCVVLTTPTVWANLLLKGMARCRLVSREEIDEHVFAYSLPLLGWYFGSAGFPMRETRFGYFECFLNLWATARRASDP